MTNRYGSTRAWLVDTFCRPYTTGHNWYLRNLVMRMALRVARAHFRPADGYEDLVRRRPLEVLEIQLQGRARIGEPRTRAKFEIRA